MKAYFFDTYALFEILAGSLRYVTLVDGTGFATTKLNLLELHHAILRVHGERAAERAFDAFAPYCLKVDDATLKRASVMKARQKKRNLSYVDCIGYTIAATIGIPFLTGDREFKGMENVEWLQ